MKRVTHLLPLLLLLACETTPEFYPTPSDRVAESVVSGAAIERFDHVDGWRVSPVLSAPLGASRVALLARLVDGAEPPHIEARIIDLDGEPGAWQPLEITWREAGQYVARVDLEFAAQEAQVRISSGLALDHLLWSALVPERAHALPETAPSEVGSVSSALRAELSGLVRTRAEWGARPTLCSFRDDVKTRMAVHHTVTAAMGDPIALLRGIQNYHMDGRGWCDVGYHFLVTLDGTVWEARPLEFLGAHVLNHNTGNIGVSFVGCYDSDHPDCRPLPPGTPPDVMVEAAASVIARLSTIYDIPLTSDRVMGHRDHVGASTICPGNDLHGLLGALRSGTVSGARFAAMYVDQTFPLASADFILAPGEERRGYIELRNIGTETWRPSETFLATTEPRLADSPLAADDWVAESRPVGVDHDVAPGETGRFEFSLKAPLVAGEYSQYFGLFQWGVAWFSDAGEGGPPDDQLQVRVTVSGNAPSDAGTPDAGQMDAAVSAMDAGPDAGPVSADPSGCGCVVAGGTSGTSGTRTLPWLLVALGLMWSSRRRRRQSWG